ncbi:LPS export ABC transporter permease LptG [Neiella marina]|uniref:LPS export ABC transporter permease LptG n=1 Tax=Neiella holothuriorum TaxID=2870530 RepID=A0ABS7EKI5_9GAMM|nr:LPS export ABC transporter permease LptG [Neiella holothuriorum]MBW8192844.1 LPS export ABC transporter permease LptG [Neiella holothuriorum]
MYSIVDRHIGRTLLGTTSLVLLVLVGLSSLIRFVQQLKHVGKGNYDIVDAVLYMLFSAPRDLEIFFPVCALMGALVGLGMLASHSELVVMQSSGLSKLNISNSVLKTAIPLAIVMMMIGEWGVPASERFAKELKSSAISGGSILSSRSGTWAKDGDSFVYIGSVLDADELHSVTQYHFDENNSLTEVFHFRDATYQEGSWLVNDVHHTRLSDSAINTQHTDTGQWQSTLTPSKLSVVSIKPDALPISGLMDYVDYLRAGRQDSTRYELAMWRKMLKPLAVATMMLLALSFIFGPLRTVTMGARIILGVIAGFAFHIADQLFGPMTVVFAVPPVISAALPSLLFLGFAIYLLRRS